MKFLNSKIFTSLAGILILWLTFSSINLTSQRSVIGKGIKSVETKIREVQDDTDHLNKFLAYFKTPAFLEREARLKLNYKSQGEEVVFIYKDKNVKKETDFVSLEEILSKIPNYKKWLLYLLGY